MNTNINYLEEKCISNLEAWSSNSNTGNKSVNYLIIKHFQYYYWSPVAAACNVPGKKSLLDPEVLLEVVLIHGHPEKPQP